MKRITACLLALVLLWALFVFSVGAEEEKTVSKYLPLDIFSEDIWEGEEGVERISKRSAGGSPMMTFTSIKDAERISVKAEFDPLDLSEYNEIVLEMQTRGGAQQYPVTVIFESKEDTSTYSDTVISSGKTFYIPLPESTRGSLSSITLTFDTAEEPLTYITLLSATADDNFTYAHLGTFSAIDILSEEKTEITETNIRLFFEEGGASLTPVWKDSFERGKDILVWVKLESTSSGSLLCSARYGETNEDTGEITYTERDTAPKTVTSDGTYVFISEGGFDTLSFKFSAVPEDDQYIDIKSCGITLLSDKVTSAGSITSCRYDGKKLLVEGSLASDASVKYYGSKLLLYAVPASEIEDFDVEKYSPIAQESFSTKFSISLTRDKFYAQSFYRVYLDTKEGKVPVGDLTCADCAYSAPPPSSSVSALYGADAGDVFETNASSVILDLRAGQLFEHDQIYSALSYSYGSTYYFNRDYLAALDNSMSFYKSAGIAVYLRLYSDREGYAFEYSADTSSSVSVMCAVSTFLSERYPWISGFIMGPAQNSKKTVISAAEAERVARLYALLTECAKSKNPSCTVFLPIAKSGADPYLTTALIQYYLAKYSSGNTAVLYEGSQINEDDCLFALKLSQLSQAFGNASDGAAVLCRFDAADSIDAVCSAYRVGCKSTAAAGLRFCALDVSKASDAKGLYDSIKVMLDTENVIASSITELLAKTEISSFSGTYPIWDFTGSYDTSDWVAGGSFDICESARGVSGRALISRSSLSLSSAGILVGKLDTPLDLGGLSAVLDLYINCEKTSTANVSVIFSSANQRYEYSATVECNTPVSLQCDIPQSLQGIKTDYAAIIVRGAESPEIQLSKIYIGDSASNDEELKARFVSVPVREEQPVLYLTVIAVVALSVTVFSVLIRKRKVKGGSKK